MVYLFLNGIKIETVTLCVDDQLTVAVVSPTAVAVQTQIIQPLHLSKVYQYWTDLQLITQLVLVIQHTSS